MTRPQMIKTSDAQLSEEQGRWYPQSPFETLECLSNPVMIAGPNMTIRYANPAATRMFRAIEQDIQKDLPHFKADEVVGKSIDVFHKHPSHQRRIMDGLKTPHDGKFTIGGKSLAFRATPKFDENNELRSVYVEWQDQTAAVRDKSQLDDLLEGISTMAMQHMDGMINVRVDSDRFDGGYRNVADFVNEMVEGHISTKKKIISSMMAFAEGDFDHQVEQFSGDRGFINDAIERARKSFKDLTDEIVNGGVKMGQGAAQNWATFGLRGTRVMGGGQSAALSI